MLLLSQARASRPPARAEVSANSGKVTSMRVLIIEDDRSIATNLYDFLTTRGHSVDAAADGVTGLHLAVTQTFDTIVLDIGLPGLDGVKLCDKLRREAQIDTPVLMLTARDTLQDKLHGFDSGADDYLVK